MIVRGKTISGPLAVLSFTSPAAKINQIRCERSLSEFTAFSDECFHFGIFLSNVHFGGINAEYFHLRSTTLKHTHKRYRRPKVRVAARTILRRKFDFSMWPPSGVQTVLRSSKPRVTFVSPPSTCLNATPNFALEGSKSTCVGDQRLPVRSTQPRVT